jgi:hypothetical protein
MKKVMLVTLVVAVCGVLHNSVLAQEERYLVTYVRSSTNTTIRSATVVTVVNQSKRSCDVQVEWFPASDPNNPVCTIPLTPMNPGTARQFCSRAFAGNQPGSLTGCTDTCGPQLIAQYQGKAIVSSSAEDGCDRIAVEARVYYTTGAQDAALLAISNSKVVFVDEGNLGD